MKANKKNNFIYKFSLITIFCVTVILLLCFVYALREYRLRLFDNAEEVARVYVAENVGYVDDTIENKINSLQLFTIRLSALSDADSISNTISRFLIENNDYVTNIRLFVDGCEYDSNRLPFEGKEHSSVLSLVGTGKAACTGVIYDIPTLSSCIAFYIPMQDGFCDAMVYFCDVNKCLGKESAWINDISGDSEYSALCSVSSSSTESSEGFIVYEKPNKGFSVYENKAYTNFFEILRIRSNDKSAIDYLENSIKESGGAVRTMLIDGQKRAVAIKTVDISDDSLYMVQVYDPYTLYGSGFDYIEHMYIIVGIVFGALLVFFAIVAYVYGHYRKRLAEIESIDPNVGWHTYRMFTAEARKILDNNKFVNYALVYINISNFKYIIEQYGQNFEDDIQKFFGNVLTKCLAANETFGHQSRGRFVALIHYRDLKELEDRLKVIYAIVYNYPELKKFSYNLKFTAGVYCIDKNENISVDKMLDNAMYAQKIVNNSSGFFNIYDTRVDDIYKQESIFEGKMEQSLKNGDFKVFYQPKYDINNDRLAGAEALIRWYDTEKMLYYSPGDFIPLFEKNGFIVNLDRYVYTEVCKYLHEAVTHGEKVYPISVNVSRVTAVQPDFLDYYIKIKKKYSIADGFIILELTESFANENYDTMKQIVEVLRDNGIHSAIDDFGMGYSSYDILKEIRMDEIKFDRLFLKKGLSEERDFLILCSTIKLAKELGYTVVQEGVEVYDDVKRLKEYGCDIIQGYYYSKPLTMHDFIDFIYRSQNIDYMHKKVKEREDDAATPDIPKIENA